MKMDNMNASAMQVQALTCNLCGGAHDNMECQVGNSFVQSSNQANFIGNFQGPQNINFQRHQNNPYSNTYKPRWRNHVNLSYRNQNQVMPPPLKF